MIESIVATVKQFKSTEGNKLWILWRYQVNVEKKWEKKCINSYREMINWKKHMIENIKRKEWRKTVFSKQKWFSTMYKFNTKNQEKYRKGQYKNDR